jgi:hypothetical protein
VGAGRDGPHLVVDETLVVRGVDGRDSAIMTPVRISL